MEVNMPTRQISQSPVKLSILHVSVATGLPYDRLIEAFEGSLGKWDPIAGERLSKEKASWRMSKPLSRKWPNPSG